MSKPPSNATATSLRRLSVAGMLAAASAVALSGARPMRAASASAPCAMALTDGEVSALGLPAVPREMRAAWMSPVEGGEWPSRPDMSPDEQRAELVSMLDRAVALHLNAVVLHVRTAADAMYPTARAPWSSYLTTTRGGRAAPGYDPLAFAVAEAHRRGLQLHAWFNPFRAAPPDSRSGERPGAAFVAREHPKWVVRYGSQMWIDPGYPEARRAVLEAITEVVDRYDIDAVHIDDYFYPYLETRTIRTRVGRKRHRRTIVRHETIAFPDDASWARYGRPLGFDSRASWRRSNISDFVASLYREVKARKRWVLVGVSPFGIWRPGYPAGVSGLDAYSEIYADSRRWLREGWVDYLAPQLYWTLDGDEHRFSRLDAWWRSENVLGRHVWPGLLTMRVASRDDAWPSSEIPAEVDALRETRAGTTESLGHVHFRLGAMAPDGPLGARLARDTYAQGAVAPASPWLGADAPDAPALDACPADSTVADTTARDTTKLPPLPTLPPLHPVETAPIRVQKDVAPAPIRVQKDAPAPPPPTGEMAPTPRPTIVGATVHVAPSGATPTRWWVVQLRDAEGQWSVRTLAGDLRDLPVALPNGVRATYAAVTAVSPAGVLGRPTVMRLE
jgi:uncharacterized lipoprotein YddW (UPF0748 family)